MTTEAKSDEQFTSYFFYFYNMKIVIKKITSIQNPKVFIHSVK